MHALTTFFTDLLHGLRTVFTRPHTGLTHAGLTALGIGCGLAVLTLANDLLITPLPFAEAERIVSLSRTAPHRERSPISVPEFEDWRDRNRSFATLSMVRATSFAYAPPGEPTERLQGLLASWSLISTLGIEPVIGRGFEPADDRPNADPVVMLGHAFWQTRFAGSADVLGRELRIDGRSFTIVGVLPARLVGQRILPEVTAGDLWMPIRLVLNHDTNAQREDRPDIFVIGRLRPEVPFDLARSDMDRVAAELAEAFPLTNKDSGILSLRLRDELLGPVRQSIWVLLAAAGLVLTMTIVNLGNLTLSRVISRHRELATRVALGASRRRLAARLIAEALASALVGAALAIPLAMAVGPVLRFLIPDGFTTALPTIPYLVWLTAPPLATLVAVLTALPAIWYATGRRALRAVAGPGDLTGQTHDGRRLRQIMVVLQIAIAAALLIGSSLLVVSAGALRAVNPGFDPASVHTFRFALGSEADADQGITVARFDQWIERIEALPGVTRAAITSCLPLEPDLGVQTRIVRPDRPLPPISEMAATVALMTTPGFFDSLGIRLTAGRFFDPSIDRAGVEPAAAIISQSVVRALFDGDDEAALGHSIGFELLGSPADFTVRARRVVGVVEDVRLLGLETPGHAIFTNVTQPPSIYVEQGLPILALVVAVDGDAAGLIPAVRAILSETAPGVPLFAHRSLERTVADATAPSSRLANVVRIFSGLALVLSAVGLFGVMAAGVAAERREIGVRSALGSSPRRILAHYLYRAGIMVAAGLALGTGVALAAAPKVLGSILYAVPPRAPMPYLAAILLLAAIALAAAVLPACRAARVPPTEVLRDM